MLPFPSFWGICAPDHTYTYLLINRTVNMTKHVVRPYRVVASLLTERLNTKQCKIIIVYNLIRLELAMSMITF